MPVDVISVRPSSDKTVHETVIETVRAKGTDPSFELKEAGNDLARMNLSAASLLALQTNIAAAGWVSYITVDSAGVLTFTQGEVTLPILSADPSTPAAGFSTLWVSDGTGSGAAGDVMSIDSAGAVDNLTSAGGGGSGDVVGPASATDNAVVRYDGATGKLIQNSNAILADNGGLTQTAVAATEVLGSFIAHATQSANMSEWKSSGGTVGAHVTESQAFHNTGGGTDSCVYGDGAGVDGDEPRCTSLGVNAICYGDDAVAIGYGATAGGSGSTVYQDNVAIGSGALSVISSGVAIGAGATTGSSGSSTAIGALASVTGNSSIAIGTGATVTGPFGVAIGQGVSSTGSGVTVGKGATGANAIGYNADASGHAQAQAWGTSCVAGAIGAVAMGYAANAGHSGAICIGDRATSTAAYQLVIGSDYLSGAVKINDVYIGEGVTSASPDGVTINSTGGEGTDIAGSDITIAGGKATGNAAGGEIIFSTSDAGATGTALQTLTEKARIDVDGNFSAVGTLNIGTGHTVSGTLASVAGGASNSNAANYGFLGGGESCSIASGADHSVVVGGNNNDITSTGHDNFIGGGASNLISGTGRGHTICGGFNNIASGLLYSTVCGGSNNESTDYWTFVGGGENNTATTDHAIVVGGQNNDNAGDSGFLGGGSANDISVAGTTSVIVGGNTNIITAANCTIGGGLLNNISGAQGTIVGGADNSVAATYGFIGGGKNCSIAAGANYSFIGGGQNTSVAANAQHVVIGGGLNNAVTGAAHDAVIGGGNGNQITGTPYTVTIAGGLTNTATAGQAAIGGGYNNTASGISSYIPGGRDCVASANYSGASGYEADTRDLMGARALASGGASVVGDRQGRDHISKGQSTTDTFVSITADGGADSASDTPQQPENSLMSLTWTVIGLQSTGAKAARYTVKALVKRYTSTTTLLWSSVTADFEDDATWDCQVIVYSLGATVQAKGASGETVNWCAKLETVEVVN